MTSLPSHHPLIIHPGWTLRISQGNRRGRGYSAPHTHLFTGVRGACEQFRPLSLFKHRVLSFLPPTTSPTCRLCCRYSQRAPLGVSPSVHEQATARMVTHSLTTRDPHVATVTLRMLGAPQTIEPLTSLLAITDSPILFLEGPTP